jgi:hypothetical protein
LVAKNPNHHLLRSVRPIGREDIVSVGFFLEDKLVAFQGNPLFVQIATNFEEDRVWPRTGHLTRSFGELPAESMLLWRASSLVNFGFYQEAILIAFSVVDAKVQELVEDRMDDEYSVKRSKTHFCFA